MTEVLALDVGGTKIAGAVLDDTGTVLGRSELPTPGADAEQTFAAVGKVVDELMLDHVEAIGIASAGPVDLTDGTVSPINIDCWDEFPLAQRVGELLPQRPVTLAGDGVCMALGENWCGAGRDSQNMLGMVVSTGVGGGLVLGGRGFRGRTGNAGHIGHVVAEAEGEECTCGGRGCVETVASGPAMVRWARVKGWQAPDHAHAEHLAAAALMGEEVAIAAFRRAGRAVAFAIAASAVVCDLDLAVVGGGVAQAGDLLFTPIQETLTEHLGLSFLDNFVVRQGELGADAGLVGAAALALQSC